jgi:hypothetical protein
MNLRAALADTENLLAQKYRERAVVDDEIQQLEAERRGLRLAIKRHDAAPVDPESLDELDLWAGLPRTEAVLWLLREVGRPMRPTEIVTKLGQRGRDDGPKVVSASLTHLQKQGKVRSEGRGEWVTTFKSARDAHLANLAGVVTSEELEAIRDSLTQESVDALSRERLVERWRQYRQRPHIVATTVRPGGEVEVAVVEAKHRESMPGRPALPDPEEV